VDKFFLNGIDTWNVEYQGAITTFVNIDFDHSGSFESRVRLNGHITITATDFT